MGKRIGLAFALCAAACSPAATPTATLRDPVRGALAEATIPIGGGPFTDLAMSPDGTRMCVAGSEFGFYGVDGKCLPSDQPSVMPIGCLAARGYFYDLQAQRGLLVYD